MTSISKKLQIHSLVVALSISSVLGLPARGVGAFTYDIGSGAATITGCDGACPTALEIPSSVPTDGGSVPVTAIGSDAFLAETSITSLVIPDSVVEIEDGAFEGAINLATITFGTGLELIGNDAFAGGITGVTSLTIPDSVTTIGGSAFNGFSGLTDLTLGTSLQSIGNSAFEGIQVTSLELPSTLTTIQVAAFRGLTELTSLVIPDSVRTLNADAFENATSLVSLVIGDSVTTISDSAFKGASSLVSLTLGSSVRRIATSAFEGASSLTNFEFPEGFTRLDEDAFKGATSITALTFPDSTVSIRNRSFQGATALQCVTIGSGLTRLNSESFKDTVSLQSFRFKGDAPSVETGGVGNVFEGSSLLTIGHLSTSAGWLETYEGLPTSTYELDSPSEILNELGCLEAVETTPVPIPYTGPLVSEYSNSAVQAGDSLTISGQRLNTVTRLTIDGVEVEISAQTVGSISFTIPLGLSAGLKDLILESSSGTLRVQDALRVSAAPTESDSSLGTKFWTKLQSDRGTVKMYAKNIVGTGKVQFFLNDKEIAWVRATSDADSKLRTVNGAQYLVRTVNLVQGQKNVLEIYVDGERVERNAYSY